MINRGYILTHRVILPIHREFVLGTPAISFAQIILRTGVTPLRFQGNLV